MKRITSMLLAMVLLFPVSATALSLQEAIELGTKNSNQLKIYRSEVDLADLSLQQARGSAVPAGSVLPARYYRRQAELNLEYAKKTLDDYKKQLELKVKTDYFAYRAAKDRQEKAFLAYSYANENLWVVNSKYLAGLASQFEDAQAALNKRRANDEREAATRAAELARQQLCATLGLALDTEIEADDELNVSDVSGQPLPNDIIDEAVENALSVIQARGAFELANMQFDAVSKQSGYDTVEYQKAEIGVEGAKERRNMAITNAKLNIYKLFNEMLNASESAQTAAESVKIAEQSYLIMVARYDIGMVANADVINSFASFKDAQITENQAKLSSAIALENYRIAVGK